MESNQNTNSSEYISGLPMGEGGGGGWRSGDGRGANSTFLQFEKLDTHAAKRYTWFVKQFRKTTLKVVKTEKYM